VLGTEKADISMNIWPWIGPMVVWNLPEPDWGTDREEYWWYIANPNGTTHPAYDALRQARQSGQLP